MKQIKTDNIISLAILVFVLIWLNKFLKSIQVFMGSENDQVVKENDKKELDSAKGEIKEEFLSHKKSEYYAMADAIEVALQAGWTEDEDAVYNVLKKLWNNSDYLMLKLAWNKRPIGVYGFRTQLTLEKAIRYYFNEAEIKKCNSILASQKGHFITYRI